MNKTYDEIKKMSPYLIKWHYLNAVRRNEMQVKNRDEELRFIMALVRPDIYKKLKEDEERDVYESQSYDENITFEEFQKKIQDRNKQLKRKEELEIEEENNFNPVSLIIE